MITHKSIGYSGRLGNQMFQYAALKALSLHLGVECYLPDNTAIKQDGCLDFGTNKWISYKLDLLDCFEITAEIKNKSENTLYIESDFTYDSHILDVEDRTAIDGYYQSYKYFESHKDVILKEFTFKKEILEKCINAMSVYQNSVAVHVRRGDQVAHPNMWNVSLEYLQEALMQFTDKKYTFIVFSDDIGWCKQVFPEGVVFMEGNTQFEDLCMMSLCQHNIISNSTYSWWAAYLNKNINKRVIAPKNWFVNEKSLLDLYLPTWNVI
jgi:hypothetical protein